MRLRHKPYRKAQNLVAYLALLGCRPARMLRRTFQCSAAAVTRYTDAPPLIKATVEVLDILRHKYRATTRLSQLGREILPHELDTSFPVFLELMTPDMVEKGVEFGPLPPQKSNLRPDLEFAKERQIQDSKRAKSSSPKT